MADDQATFAERFTGEPAQPQSDTVPLDRSQTFASSAYAAQYTQQQAEKLKFGPGFMAGLGAFARNPGALAKFIGGGLATAAASAVEFPGYLLDKAHKALTEGLTPGEEAEFGVNIALTQLGSAKEFSMPTGSKSAFDNFHKQVVEPIAQQIASPPSQPEPVRGPTRIVIPLTVPRSQLAITREPHVDAVLNSPVTKDVIDNPVIDRTHDVPYGAGGSVPLQKPVTYIDKDFPRTFSIDGKAFDPAEPFAIHENVEQHTMGILEAGGMDHGTAYKVAHFEFAEKAEGAWYKAHDIDQAKAEAAYKPYLDAIQRKAPTTIPADLYKDPYPHDQPFAAQHEALGEPRPTPDEISRAKQIIADWQAKGSPAPEPEKPPINILQEAHDLGVIGPDKESVPTDSPAQAAFRAVPLGAAVTPEAMRGRLGHAPGEYDARGKEWIDKIDAPEDAKAAIEGMARQYDFFPEARGGTPSPAARAAVAEAAGIDPSEIDKGYFAEHFDNDGKVRAVIQALRQTTKDFTEAADKQRREPSEINAAAQFEAQEKQRYVLEYMMGKRAESGRSLAAHKELLREMEHARAIPKIKTDEASGDAPRGLADLVDAASDVVNNLKPKTKGPVGLDKLVKAAKDLVEGQDKLPETRQKLGGLAKRARDLAKEAEANEAETGKTPSGLAGLISEAQELAKTLPEPPKEAGKPQPQGIPQMIAEARKAINGPSGAQALIKLAEEAERLADTMPRTPAEAAAKLPPDIAGLVGQARSLVSNLAKPGTTDLEKLVGQVDKQTRDILKSKPEAKPKDVLPPEWQALVDKADLVTKRFGGIAKGEQAALLLARAGRTAAEQAELARQVEGLTPNQIARVLQRLRTEKRPGWVFWSVQQGLISGLITHTKYAVVNTAQTVFERIISPELAAAIGRVRGEKTSLYAPLRAIPEFFNAVPDALAGAKQAFKTNSRVPLESELRLAERGEKSPEAAGAQIPYGTAQGPDWGRVGRWFPQGSKRAESILGVPGRSANSIHTVFKIFNERMAAGSRAYEKAELEGNKPGTDKFWDRYHYHLDNPTDDVLRANVEDGYSGTFMQHLGKQSEAFARLVRNTPAKWLIFFTHIPLNMARAGVEYSPLAFLNTLGETKMGAAIKGELGADAQNLAFAKIAIGTAIGGYFISRALAGKATGDYPTDQKERRRWQLEGIQPNSVQTADGQWMSLERLGPQVLPARIAANFADVIKNYDGSDNDAFMKATWATVLGTGRAVASDVGFETIRNIIDIMENPKEAARAAAYQLASYTMPVSFLAQAASFHDPYMRVANDYISALKYRLPLLREELPAKRDPLYGEPVANPGYHAIFRGVPVMQDKVKSELDRIGYFPTAPRKEIGGVKLTPEQYDKYEATAGPLVKAALNDLVRSPLWQAHSNNPAWQTVVAKQYISEARKRAAVAMQMDSLGKPGDLIAAAHERRLTQINGQ